ncbi:MAG: hypothetical protein ACREK7_01790 [Gemmatimonadota bacterium]
MPRAASVVGLPALLLLAGSSVEVLAQQCLGRPTGTGEQAIAARLDLDEISILSGEFSRVGKAVAWSVMAGAAAEELIPPQDLALALGGGAAWTGLHRALCPAGAFWTSEHDVLRRTRIRLGAGLGRRLGEEPIHGAAFLFPHVRIVRDDVDLRGEEVEDTRYEPWIDGGFSLRNERLWGMAVLGLQVGNYSPGEDVIDGSLRFAAAVAF